MPVRTPHQVAFSQWYAANIHKVNTLWREPSYGESTIKLTLNRYYPCLTAIIERDRCAVQVEWDLRLWDTLFAAEVSIHRKANLTYECVLRPPGDRVEKGWPEHLWEEYLYNPLVEWIEQTVLPRPMLHLCELNSETWARLQYQEAAPPDVLVTLHAGATKDEWRRCFISGYA